MGILAVLVSIALIMVLIRKCVNIGLAMLAGAAALAVAAPMPLGQVWGAVVTALTDPATWNLVLIILFIGILGYILRSSGALAVMVDSLLRLLGDARWLMVIIPGLIGLLTVPGGAMMSAPMVDQLGDRVKISPEHKTGVNLVYRHLWYMIFPMISSIILASSLAGIRPLQLVKLNIPVAIVGGLASWFFLLRSVNSGGEKGRWNWADIGWFSLSILPIAGALLLFIGFGLYFPLALAIGIIAALLIMPGGQGSLPRRMLSTGLERAKTMLWPGLKLEMILVVLGIMVYKEMLYASSLVTTFALGLMEMGIPLWLLLLILPFCVGMVTGVHTATVGIVIPIFLPLLGQDVFLPGLSLIYVSSTLGYLISPLHLCLILTREYYKARFGGVYKYVAPVAGLMLATALAAGILRGL